MLAHGCTFQTCLTYQADSEGKHICCAFAYGRCHCPNLCVVSSQHLPHRSKHEAEKQVIWISVSCWLCTRPLACHRVAFKMANRSTTVVALTQTHNNRCAQGYTYAQHITHAPKSVLLRAFNATAMVLCVRYRVGIPVAIIASIWLLFASAIFMIPQAYPVTTGNNNYTSAAVGGILIVALIAWLVSARHWFSGPRTDVDNSDAVKVKYWVTDPPRRGSRGRQKQWKLPAFGRWS